MGEIPFRRIHWRDFGCLWERRAIPPSPRSGLDQEQGTITSPQFKLPIGDTYRFVIIFSYGFAGGEAVPYAFADFNWLVDEFSEAVSFSENDIRYQYDAQDPSISASLSEGKIPNLDLDNDGWSNWEELRDKVSPRDANSVPIVPSVEVHGQQDGNSSSATIVVTARDNAHVEDLRLVDPLCGVTVISDTLANNVDGSVTRTLTLRLDLLSVSKNPRSLQGLADDGVTPAQNVNQTLNFTISGNASQPYFVFTEPEENAEIEGETVFHGIACSRDEINIPSAKFLNQEVNSAGWTGQKNIQTGDYELQSDLVNTVLLPDGPNSFKVEVSDANNKVGQGARTYRVVNDNEIKIVSPVGRRWVFGNEQIAATVKNLSDSNLVVIEGDSSFSLTSSTAGGAVGRLGVGNLPEGTVVPLTFRAVRSDGSEITRKVDFTVRNKPQIVLFQPEASKPFRNWSTNLNYRVLNVDPNQLSIGGQPTAEAGQRQCSEDTAAKGITVCSGTFPIKVTGNQTYTLNSFRGVTSGETCANCSASQDYTMTPAGNLPNDIPEINAAIAVDDEPESPERIAFPSESPAKAYRLTIRDIRHDTEIFSTEANSGQIVTLTGLEARTDYHASIQVMDGPGGNLEQEMFKDFTTGDLGLVGWWRFKDVVLGKDSSGKNNHGTAVGATKYQSGEESALAFNEFGNRMDAPINGFSSNQGTLTFWFIPEFDLFSVIGNGANADIVSLLNIGGWNINSLRVIYSNSSAYCPTSDYDHSLCLGVHGAPVPEPISNIGQKFLPSGESWNFGAVTWNQGTNQISLYNSITNTTVTYPVNFAFSFANNKISFGYSGVTSDGWPAFAFWYKGLLRDVQGYNRTLFEGEIKDICNNLIMGQCP
ncbi:MAG: hypothetical protein K8R69_12265 [Deltaproteobacteria bacterium]|nr:hypothetical protein [Deltaproteobacteria bacterium]